MKTVTVRTDELIKIIQENRDIHRETFLKAQVVYRERLIEALDSMLAEARKGSHVKQGIWMPEPEDHTDDYNRVIRMLELHTLPEVELSQQEAAQYVMDDWGWKAQWSQTTEFYAAQGA